MRYLKLKLFKMRLKVSIEIMLFVCAVFRAILRIVTNTKHANMIVDALIHIALKTIRYADILDKLKMEPN